MIPDPQSNRALRSVAIAIYALCALLSCERPADPEPAARNAQTARIITVGGAVTETVFALGAGAQVVAVDTSSVYPDAIHALPKVGYQRTLAAEGILALRPDLVVTSDEAGPPAVLDQLRSAGVRVVRTSPTRNIDEAVARITAIGEAIGRPAAALSVQVQREAHAARARVAPDGPRFVLVYARGAGTLMVAGTDGPGTAMVELAGGRNAVTGFTGYKPLSAEVLIQAAPDVIVVPSRGLTTLGGEAGMLAVPGVADTPAGKAKRIVAFDDLLLLGFGPRLGPAIDELAKLLRGAPAKS